jgi:RNA recognition motif-containing protein
MSSDSYFSMLLISFNDAVVTIDLNIFILFVGFIILLLFCCREEELEEHFSQFGDVLQIHLVVDKETKRSKGIAYIHFSVPDFAAK